jgi:hypothetical protein
MASASGLRPRGMQQNLIFRFCLFCMPNPVWKETERGGGEAVHVQQHENARRREPSKGSRTPRRNLAFLSFHHACVNAPAGAVVTATSTNKHQISLSPLTQKGFCLLRTSACHMLRAEARQCSSSAQGAACGQAPMHPMVSAHDIESIAV